MESVELTNLDRAILRLRSNQARGQEDARYTFESLTTAIRYVRYTPGIKILLARHASFSFFIAIIPSLMPVVGLKELHLEASHLGYLFTSMAVGSVISGAFIIPWARQVFPATDHYLRESLIALRFLFDGLCRSTVRVLSGCSARRHGVDFVCFRALGTCTELLPIPILGFWLLTGPDISRLQHSVAVPHFLGSSG